MQTEPLVVFALTELAFAAAIVCFAWALSSYKGLPNVLVVMVVLIARL